MISGCLPRKSTLPTGAAIGNFPQAFTHVGLINVALTIARVRGERRLPRAPLLPTYASPYEPAERPALGLLGTMVTPSRDRAMLVGVVMHLMNGWAFALI